MPLKIQQQKSLHLQCAAQQLLIRNYFSHTHTNHPPQNLYVFKRKFNPNEESNQTLQINPDDDYNGNKNIKNEFGVYRSSIIVLPLTLMVWCRAGLRSDVLSVYTDLFYELQTLANH
jgi:hypothetical protein